MEPTEPVKREQQTAVVPTQRSPRRHVFARYVVQWAMPVATVLLAVFFTYESSMFLSAGNLSALLTDSATAFLVATVFAMLLMTGGVDLSVGSILALAGVTSGLVFNSVGVFAGVAAGIGVGVAVGVINGILISYYEFSPIIVTLGGLAAARGIARLIAPNSIFGFPPIINAFGSGSFLGLSYLTWLAAVVALICVVIMGLLPLGRWIIAIGINPEAAFRVGIRVKPTVFWLYVASAVAAAVAGILTVSRLDSAPSGTMGLGFEVTVLTAVLLGGVPFYGGRGSIWRVLLGVLLIGIVTNGLTMMNASPEIGQIATGIVLVGAAALEALRRHVGTLD